MVAIKNHEADRYLTRPQPDIFLYLVFGSDAGLAAERVRIIINRSVADPKNPFHLVRIDGDALAADPLRLADEANTVPLFGGQRAIWIEAKSKAFHSAVEPILASPPRDCTIVIEAGTLKKDAPLRMLCERAKGAAAIQCFPDTEKDIGQLIDSEVRAAKLSIAPDAKAFLVTQLGQDRLSTRAELEKLVLYAHGTREITLDHVAAIVSDATNLIVDETVNKAFQGELAALDTHLKHISGGAGDHQALLASALRHAMELHRARSCADESLGVSHDNFRFRGLRQREMFDQHLRAWSVTALAQAINTILKAIAQSRKEPGLGACLAARALWAIASLRTKTARCWDEGTPAVT
jgi:DNA polymerase-3 subunit delta